MCPGVNDRISSSRAGSMTGNGMPLICLPFAGAGPSFFNEWSGLTRSLEIFAPLLPGREKRFLDEPYRDAKEAVDAILPGIVESIQGRNVFIFGHSLGAVLAFELAWQLRRRRPEIHIGQLFVSGSPSPWAPRERRATGLDDQRFLEQVREFAGYEHPALSDPDMREMLLPVLRADVEMHENYLPPAEQVLDIPITTIRGSHDELVSAEEAAEWENATTGSLQTLEMPGSHMYLVSDAKALLQRIEAVATSAAPAPDRSPVQEGETPCDSREKLRY